ncbi:hypothetical protein DPMN_175648 [Dreissena polymorpha]|uniref:Uncharacterized protein n=1 Tax=Dreissena polymorpha TaxID=45954 RepID=A0A9D4E9S8_DREPO|nr:hypothetical protein DPMN_175648 [Dreissena polymorpha]
MNNKWPHGGNVFQQTGIIFELVQDIIKTNLLTKFNEDTTIYVASTVFTWQIFMTHNGRQTIDKRLRQNCQKIRKQDGSEACLLYKYTEKDPPGGHVMMIIIMNVDDGDNDRSADAYNAYDDDDAYDANAAADYDNDDDNDMMKNETIRRYTSFAASDNDDDRKDKIDRDLTGNIKLPTGGHVFQQTRNIFRVGTDIIRTHVLTKFHEDWTIHASSKKSSPPPGDDVF